MAVENTLAYHITTINPAVKSFIVLAQAGAYSIKDFCN
jgi:hypothetical protein